MVQYQLHYIVPEVEDDTEIRLSGNKLWEEYTEAKALGIETKPVVVGAYTLLKLCRYTGKKSSGDYIDAVIRAYQDLLKKCGEYKIAWVQFDEPALVRDMDQEDLALFHKIYDAVLTAGNESKVLLQTYFGDVRDIYPDLIKMPFAGIGLDFIEGKETYNLIETYGFPHDKLLFAGLVNGKNIWKNHYEKTLQILGALREKGIRSVLSTSCSLLHVPYTLKHENVLSSEYLAYFAFAEEKLAELKELKILAECGDYRLEAAYQNNKKLFAGERDCVNEDVHKRLSLVTEDDYVRLPERRERQKLQKKELALPEFPTTTIGSFPQTKDVKANRSAYRRGEISESGYVAFNRKKIAECVAWQEEIGLDVLVHGEYERNDMVEYFGEALGGFLFTEKAWVQSYGTRCVKPPIIWGDVYREKPITVEWSVYAQSLTKKIMKGMLTGPVTILNWSFPREDISIKESISQIALAIRDEVLDALMLGKLTQDALSAVSLASQIAFVQNLFLAAMTIGLSMFAAQYWGKGEINEVEKIFAYVLKISMTVSFVFTFVTLCTPAWLMRIFTSEVVLIENGVIYLRAVSVSYFLTGISQIYLCVLKNSGKAFKSSMISSASVILNIVLNAILIFGLFGFPKLGIAGAAFATVIARIIEVLWCILETLKKDSVKLRWANFTAKDRTLCRRFWKYTSPVLGNEIVWGCGFTMYSVIMGHLGSDAVAANSIANIVKNLVACFCLGLGSGGGIIVGNELGAGNLDTAKIYGKKLCVMSAVCGILSGLLLLALSPVILSVTNLSEQATEYLKWMLVMCSYYLVGKSVNGTTIAGIFCAGGDSRFGFLCDAVTMWCIIVPLALIAAFIIKVPVLMVYFIVNLDEIVKLPAVYRHYKKYHWIKDLTNKEGL